VTHISLFYLAPFLVSCFHFLSSTRIFGLIYKTVSGKLVGYDEFSGTVLECRWKAAIGVDSFVAEGAVHCDNDDDLKKCEIESEASNRLICHNHQ
jgi:hypothetical protein